VELPWVSRSELARVWERHLRTVNQMQQEIDDLRVQRDGLLAQLELRQLMGGQPHLEDQHGSTG
jgi:hypothetical protein